MIYSLTKKGGWVYSQGCLPFIRKVRKNKSTDEKTKHEFHFKTSDSKHYKA